MTDEDDRRIRKQQAPTPAKPLVDKEASEAQASASDIFASNEATHLLEQGAKTSLLDVLDIESVEGDPAVPVSDRLSQKDYEAATKIYKLEADETAAKQDQPATDVEKATKLLDQGQLIEEAEAILKAQQSTQMLSTIDDKQEADWLPGTDSTNLLHKADRTRVLNDDFASIDEKTAFFDANSELASPNRKSETNQSEKPFVDPTPRRSLNKRSSIDESIAGAEHKTADEPNIQNKAAKLTKRRSASNEKRSTRTASKNGGSGAPRARGSESKNDVVNAGVFSADASQIVDDVVDELVKASWAEVPNQGGHIVNQHRKPARFKTAQLWLLIGLGFVVLIAIGLTFRAPPENRDVETDDSEQRATNLLVDDVKRLGIRLPISTFSRRLRPGTDMFLLGRRDVVVKINGTDASKSIHADSLWTTLKQGRNISAIVTQLSGVSPWPIELDMGLDMNTPISEVERLTTSLVRRGVQRVNLLTDSEQMGGFGEIGLDVRLKLDNIPAIGAVQMEVKDAKVSVVLLKPQQPPRELVQLETFEPRLEEKLDKVIETFAFENPRVVRAVLSVPKGLRLKQVIELAKPLLLDERMRRVTVIPYGLESPKRQQP